MTGLSNIETGLNLKNVTWLVTKWNFFCQW